jgi:hypothetical protein
MDLVARSSKAISDLAPAQAQDMRTAVTLKASMKHQRDANGASNVGLGEAAQITALIIDLRRIAHVIEGDIAREEKEAGVFDLSSAAYPIMGRILRVRSNNLGNTIASLDWRLASLLRATEPSNPVLKTRFAG